MHARRRICCNAVHAFRPATALRSVFIDTAGLRFTSTGNSQDALQGTASRESGSLGTNAEVLIGEASKYAEKAAREQSDTHQVRDVEPSGDEKPVLRYVHISKGQVTPAPSAAQARPKKRQTTSKGNKLLHIVQKKVASQAKEVLEYDGQYVRPTLQAREARVASWLQGTQEDESVSKYKRAGIEVAAFAAWMRPTEAEIAAREAVVDQTIRIIKSKLSDYDVEVFGSARNGLALASSDVDLRLYQQSQSKTEAQDGLLEGQAQKPPAVRVRWQNFKALQKLEQAFHHHSDYIIGVNRHARYPLHFIQHAPSGIDVQIVCSNDTTDQRKLIARYVEEYPGIADMFAVIKTALDIRGLTDVFRGGIGSYSIFIMIVAALNHSLQETVGTKRRILREDGTDAWVPALQAIEDDHEKLARMISRVLSFYVDLDTYKDALRADPYARLPKISPTAFFSLDEAAQQGAHLRVIDESQPYLLCLEDPADPTNDLGRKAYGWKHIRKTLESLSWMLRQDLSKAEKVHSYLLPSVGAAPQTYDVRRRLTEAYGQRVLDMPEAVEAEAESALKVMEERERLAHRKGVAVRKAVVNQRRKESDARLENATNEVHSNKGEANVMLAGKEFWQKRPEQNVKRNAVARGEPLVQSSAPQDLPGHALRNIARYWKTPSSRDLRPVALVNGEGAGGVGGGRTWRSGEGGVGLGENSLDVNDDYTLEQLVSEAEALAKGPEVQPERTEENQPTLERTEKGKAAATA